MARGKSLKIFMMDGHVAGRWICTLAGRTTKAYRIPRILYKKCFDIEELRRPAVYLLFGDEGNGSRPLVYVGETEDAYNRLKIHEDKKEFWNEAIVFISQDDHFNKAHVKYLEGRLYDIAVEVDRYTVVNAQKPISASIAIDEQAEMEDFIDNVAVLTFGMGHKVFEPLIEKTDEVNRKDNKEAFHIENKSQGVNATMIRTVEGYVVLKGSTIREDEVASFPTGAKEKRSQLRAEGTIKDGTFTRDVLFLSASNASTLILGRNSNGLKDWKTKEGVILRDVLKNEKS